MHFENTADATDAVSGTVSANPESGSEPSDSIPLGKEETKPEVSALPEVGMRIVSTCNE